MIALEIVLHRRASTLWVWRHGAGLKAFGKEELLKAVGHLQDEIREVAGFHARNPKWRGGALNFDLEFTLVQGSEDKSISAHLRWDAATRGLREVERRELP
jgi:hypothetical protein